MNTARNPDKWRIAVIGLIQIGIIFSLVLFSATMKKCYQPYEEDVPRLMLIYNKALFLVIVPLIWTALTGYLYNAQRRHSRLCTAMIVIGVTLCVCLAIVTVCLIRMWLAPEGMQGLMQ